MNFVIYKDALGGEGRCFAIKNQPCEKIFKFECNSYELG